MKSVAVTSRKKIAPEPLKTAASGAGRTQFANVFEALVDSPEEAANLRARADLVRQIGHVITAKGWTQAVAATHCGISQPRMSDLMAGRLSLFSLDALVNIASQLGTVRVELTRAQ
jgi:predicted XRE-type DNA-binding protein